MLRRAVLYKFSDVSEVLIASINNTNYILAAVRT
jgi:hypothetical protein